MKKCSFCKSIITQKGRRIYCSRQCVKKAWYVLHMKPESKSIYKDYGEFLKTETGIGYFWEKYVADKYGGKHLAFNPKGIDVEIKGLNYDVKVCEKYKINEGGQWVFNRNNKKDYIDFYYCICLEQGKIFKELKIPTNEFNSCGITVGRVSKYDKFVV